MKNIAAVIAIAIAGALPVRAADTLTADQALSISIEHSPQMVQARLSLERSRESLKALKATQKVKVSLQLTPIDYSNQLAFNTELNTWNASRSTQSSGMLQAQQPLIWTDGVLSLSDRFGWQQSYSDLGGATREGFDHNLTLSLTQPIFTYNRSKQQLKQQELDLENQAITYAIKRLSMETSVAQAFYALYRSQADLEFSEDECRNQQKSLSIVAAKVEAGLTSRDQLYQAQLNLASSETSRKNREVQLLNAADALQRLLGISLERQIRVRTSIDTGMVPVDSARALGQALASRMELRQRKIDIENARFALVQAAATNEFKGSVTASVGLVGADSDWKTAIIEPTNNQKAAITLQIPLWDWGERRARIKASQTGVTTAAIAFDEEKADITMAIRQSLRSIRNLYSQIATAKQSVEFAKLTYELNLERYERGDLTSMQLQDFQTQLTQKRMDLINTLISYRLELLNLKVISLWDFERNEAVVVVRDK